MPSSPLNMKSGYVNLSSLVKTMVQKSRALNKSEYLMIFFSYFSLISYIVTLHLNCLTEMVQMRDDNMFLCRINKNYP